MVLSALCRSAYTSFFAGRKQRLARGAFCWPTPLFYPNLRVLSFTRTTDRSPFLIQPPFFREKGRRGFCSLPPRRGSKVFSLFLSLDAECYVFFIVQCFILLKHGPSPSCAFQGRGFFFPRARARFLLDPSFFREKGPFRYLLQNKTRVSFFASSSTREIAFLFLSFFFHLIFPFSAGTP